MKIEKLTSKQIEILILLYRFRFLTTNHLKLFLNHKNHSLIGRYLRDMHSRKIIGRIYSTRREYVNSPAIYYLDNKSLPILEEKYSCFNPALVSRIYREKTRSKAFVDRCLFIADLYFHFLAAAEREKRSLGFYTATDLSEVAYAPRPLPDAFLLAKNKQSSKRYFLEYFEEKLPMRAVRAKTKRYFEYFVDNYWQDNHPAKFPTILLICSQPRVQRSLNKFIREQHDEYDIEMQVFLAQKNYIDEHGIRGKVWSQVEMD